MADEDSAVVKWLLVLEVPHLADEHLAVIDDRPRL